MRKLSLTPKFSRSFKKFVLKSKELQLQIEGTLMKMEQDVFDPSLGTHKLKGELFGLLACSCGFDCRIIFKFEKIMQEEIIVLLDIGTHDEVY